jgi:hypothetical protein
LYVVSVTGQRLSWQAGKASTRLSFIPRQMNFHGTFDGQEAVLLHAADALLAMIHRFGRLTERGSELMGPRSWHWRAAGCWRREVTTSTPESAAHRR